MNKMSWAAVAFVAAAIASAAGPACAQTNIIVTAMSPAGSPFSNEFFRPWADKIAADAKGALTLDVRDGFAVANFGNVYDRVMNDVVQLGWAMQGLIGGQFPLTEVATFPFEADSSEQASVALWRLYQSGQLAREYANVKPLALGTYPMNGLHYAKAPATLDNLNGLKLRAASKPQGEWISHLGGTPITLNPEELYGAMQRGVVDATLQAWSAFGPLKLADVTTHHLDVRFGTSTIMLFMSPQKYASLPDAARKAIDDNSGEGRSRAWGQFIDANADKQGKMVLATPGHTRLELSPAQLASWRQRVAPVADAWKKAQPDGEAIFARYRATLADVKAGK